MNIRPVVLGLALSLPCLADASGPSSLLRFVPQKLRGLPATMRGEEQGLAHAAYVDPKTRVAYNVNVRRIDSTSEVPGNRYLGRAVEEADPTGTAWRGLKVKGKPAVRAFFGGKSEVSVVVKDHILLVVSVQPTADKDLAVVVADEVLGRHD